MVRVIAKSTMWAVCLLVAGYSLVFTYWFCTDGRWSRIHSEHDPRLIGRWKGELRANWHVAFNRDYKRPFDISEFRIEPNGDWKVIGGPYAGTSYRWGTREGELQVKYLAVDAWVTARFHYEISADGNNVSLIPPNSGRIPGVWHRVTQ